MRFNRYLAKRRAIKPNPCLLRLDYPPRRARAAGCSVLSLPPLAWSAAVGKANTSVQSWCSLRLKAPPPHVCRLLHGWTAIHDKEGARQKIDKDRQPRTRLGRPTPTRDNCCRVIYHPATTHDGDKKKLSSHPCTVKSSPAKRINQRQHLLTLLFK